MEKYYCPYCNPKYQFSKIDSSGKLICGLCGDDLIKKPIFKLKQAISILIIISFVGPLIYLFFVSFLNLNNDEKETFKVDINSILKDV